MKRQKGVCRDLVAGGWELPSLRSVVACTAHGLSYRNLLSIHFKHHGSQIIERRTATVIGTVSRDHWLTDAEACLLELSYLLVGLDSSPRSLGINPPTSAPAPGRDSSNAGNAVDVRWRIGGETV